MRRRSQQLPEVIETERLVMTLPSMKDHAQWAALRREDEVALRDVEPKWSSTHLSRYHFRKRVRWSRMAFRNQYAIPLLIKMRVNEALIGGVTLDNIQKSAKNSAELGYWLHHEAQGQGFMREALSALEGYCFEALNISRIEAACRPDNERSQRLLRALDFVHEGTARSFLLINGVWQTHDIYAKLRNDRRHLQS